MSTPEYAGYIALDSAREELRRIGITEQQDDVLRDLMEAYWWGMTPGEREAIRRMTALRREDCDDE